MYSTQMTLLHLGLHQCGVCMLSCFSCVPLFVTLWTVACHAPLSMEFSRQENWSGLCTLQQQLVGSEASVPRLESTGSVVSMHGLVTPQHVGSSSPTRDQTHVSCIGRPILSHQGSIPYLSLSSCLFPRLYLPGLRILSSEFL